MTEDEASRNTGTEGEEGGAEGGEPNEEPKSKTGRMGDGIRQGLGVLSAFKDALEETIQEARDRGDLSTERAKQVMKETLEKAQSAAEEAKERLEFVRHNELDGVTEAVEALRSRVAALEEAVFGQSGVADAASGESEPDTGEGDDEEATGEAG